MDGMLAPERLGGNSHFPQMRHGHSAVDLLPNLEERNATKEKRRFLEKLAAAILQLL
jgi:hypothetical protein